MGEEKHEKDDLERRGNIDGMGDSVGEEQKRRREKTRKG